VKLPVILKSEASCPLRSEATKDLPVGTPLEKADPSLRSG
jgi:hypothetical protein